MTQSSGGRAVRPSPEVACRRLVDRGVPDLEFVQTAPWQRGVTPLLFLHGAFAGAWCWSECFLSFFAERGRPSAAVSLRGHGGSAGGRELRSAVLLDLVDDLRRAIAAIGEPPVLIGHSLGGYLAQLILGSVRLRGIVLMGSLPPDGMTLVGPQLALLEPGIWAESAIAVASDSQRAVRQASLELMFGEDVPPEKVRVYAGRMIPEAPRAFLEVHVPRPIVPAPWTGVPALVLNGAEDRLIRSDAAWRTALYHGAEFSLQSGGHFLMLDKGQTRTARRILDWLDQNRL